MPVFECSLQVNHILVCLFLIFINKASYSSHKILCCAFNLRISCQPRSLHNTVYVDCNECWEYVKYDGECFGVIRSMVAMALINDTTEGHLLVSSKLEYL
jgi:hypothetical protein